jgi:leucyl aminopeptidase
MDVAATTASPLETDADTLVVGLFAGEGVAHDTPDGTLQALVDSGEARTGAGKVAVAHAAGRRFVVVGLGPREEWDPERAREVAAAAEARARDLDTRHLCWEAPHGSADAVVGGLVEGTILSAYRYRRYLKGGEASARDAQLLTVSAHHDVSAAVYRAEALARGQNRVRDLQNAPANDMTPEDLAARAHAIAGVETSVLGREAIVEEGMGAFACVAQGSLAEPRLITMTYDGPGARGPVLGLVGKAVTFDSGGYSLKAPARMHEMKFDMSGGAAVIEAIATLVELGVPCRVIGVIGATENLVNGRAVKPGDIVRSREGLTIEVNNTDAEGRLVLCDCLSWARSQGAERLLDLATLTGGVVSALGDVYAGLLSKDEAWAAEVAAAAEEAGELVWRLPMHPRYAKAMDGRYADLLNSAEARTKAQPSTAAEFLAHFTGDVPWAHLDIAGVADDAGLAYARKGGAGFGLRTLVTLAERVSSAPS